MCLRGCPCNLTHFIISLLTQLGSFWIPKMANEVELVFTMLFLRHGLKQKFPSDHVPLCLKIKTPYKIWKSAKAKFKGKWNQKVSQHFSLSGVVGVRRLAVKLHQLYIKSPEEEEELFLHLSTSEYAASCGWSVGLLDPWPWTGLPSGDDATAGSLLAAVFVCRGTRRGAAVLFHGDFLSGAGVLAGFAAPPWPEPCLPPRVMLVATEAVNVCSSWEADRKRRCSSVSAASANMESAPLRRLQESQHSLLYPGMEQYRARTSIWQKMDLSPWQGSSGSQRTHRVMTLCWKVMTG